MKGARLMRGHRSILIFSALLDMWPGRVLAAAVRPGLDEKGVDSGDIDSRGGTVLIKDKIHACVFDLIFHHTSQGRDGLLDVQLGAPVCVDDISKASCNCGMPAIDAAAVPTPIAVVLLSSHRLATYRVFR